MPDKVLSAAVVMAIIAATAFTYGNFPQSHGGVAGGPGAASIVPANQIISGGPPPDGIPSIDNPKFVTAANASTFLTDDHDWVIGISYNGDVRAYPLQIMVWHEIVNDVVDGVPLAVTYCPLCYSTAAFVRVINGTPVQFGTSGKLYNNNLVMYDRLTKSLWSQIWGEAISGRLSGHKLQTVPIDVTTWGEWKKLYPGTMVLSRQTGFDRPYGDDPYGNYYTSNSILFPLSHLDKRFPPKTAVLGLNLSGASKAYVLANLTAPTWTDSIGGRPVQIWKLGGVVRFFEPMVDGKLLTFRILNGTLVDLETNSSWNFDGVATSGPLKGESMTRYVSETAFWFAWAAFYPNTLVFPAQ